MNAYGNTREKFDGSMESVDVETRNGQHEDGVEPRGKTVPEWEIRLRAQAHELSVLRTRVATLEAAVKVLQNRITLQ